MKGQPLKRAISLIGKTKPGLGKMGNILAEEQYEKHFPE